MTRRGGAGYAALATDGDGTLLRKKHMAADTVAAVERLEPLVHDVYGPDPFHPLAFDAAWRTPTVVALANGMYESRDFSPMPILADALQDAGCDNEAMLNHCRGPGPHVRGCWVVDLVLGKE